MLSPNRAVNTPAQAAMSSAYTDPVPGRRSHGASPLSERPCLTLWVFVARLSLVPYARRVAESDRDAVAAKPRMERKVNTNIGTPNTVLARAERARTNPRRARTDTLLGSITARLIMALTFAGAESSLCVA